MNAAPDVILSSIFGYLDIIEIWKIREVCKHWKKIIQSHQHILPKEIDLSRIAMIPYMGALGTPNKIICNDILYNTGMLKIPSIKSVSITSPIKIIVEKHWRELIAPLSEIDNLHGLKKAYVKCVNRVNASVDIEELGVVYNGILKKDIKFMHNIKVVHFLVTTPVTRKISFEFCVDTLVLEGVYKEIDIGGSIAPNLRARRVIIINSMPTLRMITFLRETKVKILELYNMPSSYWQEDEKGEMQILRYSQPYHISLNVKEQHNKWDTTDNVRIMRDMIDPSSNAWTHDIDETRRCMRCRISFMKRLQQPSCTMEEAMSSLESLLEFDIHRDKIYEIISDIPTYSKFLISSINSKCREFMMLQKARPIVKCAKDHLSKLDLDHNKSYMIEDINFENQYLISCIITFVLQHRNSQRIWNQPPHYSSDSDEEVEEVPGIADNISDDE